MCIIYDYEIKIYIVFWGNNLHPEFILKYLTNKSYE